MSNFLQNEASCNIMRYLISSLTSEPFIATFIVPIVSTTVPTIISVLPECLNREFLAYTLQPQNHS